MATSQARIEANRRNGALSRGPTSQEGKNVSRANALKHGLTSTVLPSPDAAEVERLAEAYRKELDAPGEVGADLARRMAFLKVRMDRCARYEEVVTRGNVRRALDEFVPPEGASPEEVDRLRAEVKALAEFDPSREASLVRKYEAAAERGYLRAMKEIRLLKGADPKAAAAERKAGDSKSPARLGSFLPQPNPPQPEPPKAAETPRPAPLPPPSPRELALQTAIMDMDRAIDRTFAVPIAIGKAR